MKKNIKLILLLSLFFLLPTNTKAFEIVPSGKNEYGESYKNITIEDVTNAINNDTKEYTKSLTPTLNNKYNTLDHIYYFESGGNYDTITYYFNEKEKIKYIIYQYKNKLYATIFPQRTYIYYNGTSLYKKQELNKIDFIRETITNKYNVETWQQIKIKKDNNIIKYYSNLTNLNNETNEEIINNYDYFRINGFESSKSGTTIDGIDLEYNYNTNKWEHTNLYVKRTIDSWFYKYENKIAYNKTENISSFDYKIIPKVEWNTIDANLTIIENDEIIKEFEEIKNYEIQDSTEEKETINENDIKIYEDITTMIKTNLIQISKNDSLYKLILITFITSLIIIIKNKI